MGFFDLNRDGKIDLFETVMGFAFLEAMEEEENDEDELFDDDDDFFDDDDDEY